MAYDCFLVQNEIEECEGKAANKKKKNKRESKPLAEDNKINTETGRQFNTILK